MVAIFTLKFKTELSHKDYCLEKLADVEASLNQKGLIINEYWYIMYLKLNKS